MTISNVSNSDDDLSSNAALKKQVFSKAKRRKTNKMPKMTVLTAYFGVFILVVSVISVGYQTPQQTGVASPVATVVESPTATPVSTEKPSVDELVATNVAANLAEQTNMPVASNVANLSVSLAAKSELAQTDETAIVKPQIVQPTATSREITNYTVKDGDTVATIAASFGLTPETVRWANNLAADSVSAGKVLTIPPVDGVIYTVKSGDTPDSIAGTYSASKERIISFNDLEISGLQQGSKIVIPSGSLPEDQRPGYQAPLSRPTTSSYGGSSGYRVNSNIAGMRSGSVGNKYAWGYCTWYAYERRAQMGLSTGSFWGNANTWGLYARASGYPVSNKPTVGAILVDRAGYYGHVAVVESVSPNGDIVVSEMNNAAYGGFGIVNRRTITAGQASVYQYIR
jgi:N-acetylmuramoyl-L-alanine amidase